MNGAISETIFNVFFKLNFEKVYDAILVTPLGIGDIALGELMWAMIRATIHAVAFIGVMLVMGLLISPWAVLALPATLFCSLAFCAAGLATTTYLRTVQDFDLPFGLGSCPCSCSVGRSSRSASTPSGCRSSSSSPAVPLRASAA